ncbi:hypothetical protein, partial [Mesorhizobium sp. M1E.F.Ca.ET.063.01.1.1]|uniref:hypothetical protein n=1 Tax=Mesorhizobium sp. M1E.F.Ca.ET.063.01.1.1 TaxID=2496750 RepID=UPI001AECA262
MIGGSDKTAGQPRCQQWQGGDIEPMIIVSSGFDALHAKGKSAFDDDGMTLHCDKDIRCRRYESAGPGRLQTEVRLTVMTCKDQPRG